MKRTTAAVLAGLGSAGAELLGGVELPGAPAGAGSRPGERELGSGGGRTAEASRTTALGEPVYGRAAGNDIQGAVVPGFNKDHQRLVFLRIGDVDGARAWLRWLAPRIATMNEVLDFRRAFRAARLRLGVRDPGLSGDGARVPELTSMWTSFALSYKGIEILAGPAEAARFGDESFRQGLAARSTYLGDPTDPAHPGHRDRWVVGGPQSEADVLITVAADAVDDLETAVAAIVSTAEQHGLTVVSSQRGDNLPGDLAGHEHFGFKDGISQPGIRGGRSGLPGDEITPRYLAADDAHATLFGKPGQPLVWPGQFLLGEPRQDPQDPRVAAAPSAAFPDWARLGSYVVVRRLAQDVVGFWDWMGSAAEAVGVDPVAFASALVGRWPSGAPVMRSPHHDDPALAGDDFASNHFLFQDDTRPSSLVPIEGYAGDTHPAAAADVLARVCPHAAHIRKVNPRDSATDFGAPADTLTRLMLRRGIPYGPALVGVADPSPELVEAERGLLFVACMSSIEDQFEFVSRRWANSVDQPNAGGVDPIIGQVDRAGQRVREVVRPGASGDVALRLESDFVTPTGGGYFFAPPISAVDGILAGE
ncbi:Dyp-type peroxidase family [Humibacillus xanthopallidus]|uniref:Dyp-type peroxidase family n=1 Tax=Humibacillus xanthopallidus TaxID=412689 RepID=A0A543PX58_9MICO|nr:Dyp-type peroxidase [Humibacillus xanthopallidus]TQN48630.1 Dyp-type peroxidase family [Humibacillus xanthopallidus]